MIKQVLADLLTKAIPGQLQAEQSNRSVIDQTFEEVFSSITNTSERRQDSPQATDDKSNITDAKTGNDEIAADRGVREKPEVSSEESHVKETGVEKKQDGGNDTVEDAPKAVAADTNEKIGETEKTVQAVAEVVEKINELLKSDPAALQKLLAGVETMTFRDLLTALGLESQSMESLSKIVDLDSKLPKQALQTLLLSGQPAGAILQSLKEMSPNKALIDEIVAAVNKESGALNTNSQTKAVEIANKENSTTSKPDINLVPVAKEAAEVLDGGGKGSQQSKPDNPAQAKPNVQTNQVLKQAQSMEAALTSAQQAQVKPEAAQTTAKTTANFTDLNVSGDNVKKADMAQMTVKTARAGSSAFERMLMTQIVEKARIMTRPNGSSNMILKLDPPNLGRIDIRIVTHDNMVQAIMLAESREVKMVIESNLDNLKSALNSSGLKVDQITVGLSDDGFRFRNENLAKEQGTANKNRQNGSAPDNGDELDINGVANTTARVVHDGLLDVVA